MNFKALALGSVIALSSVFGTVGSAEARPSTCWYFTQGSSSAPARSCDVNRQVDEHGTWWSINYDQRQIRLYNDGTAQIWWNGDNNNGANWYHWEYDRDGDISILSAHDGSNVVTFRR